MADGIGWTIYTVCLSVCDVRVHMSLSMKLGRPTDRQTVSATHCTAATQTHRPLCKGHDIHAGMGGQGGAGEEAVGECVGGQVGGWAHKEAIDNNKQSKVKETNKDSGEGSRGSHQGGGAVGLNNRHGDR